MANKASKKAAALEAVVPVETTPVVEAQPVAVTVTSFSLADASALVDDLSKQVAAKVAEAQAQAEAAQAAISSASKEHSDWQKLVNELKEKQDLLKLIGLGDDAAFLMTVTSGGLAKAQSTLSSVKQTWDASPAKPVVSYLNKHASDMAAMARDKAIREAGGLAKIGADAKEALTGTIIHNCREAAGIKKGDTRKVGAKAYHAEFIRLLPSWVEKHIKVTLDNSVIVQMANAADPLKYEEKKQRGQRGQEDPEVEKLQAEIAMLRSGKTGNSMEEAGFSQTDAERERQQLAAR